MEGKQINSAVELYKRTGDQTIFSNLYERLKPRLERRVFKETERCSILDEGDVWGAIHLALTKAIEKFDETKGNFMNLFYKILRNEIDKLKKEMYKKVCFETVSLDADDDEDKPRIEVHDHLTESVEEIVIRKIQRKIEQRQLLDSLKLPDIINSLLEECDPDVFEAKTSLGKALGFQHHQQVTRWLDRIRKSYDYERFGPIGDYFTA